MIKEIAYNWFRCCHMHMQVSHPVDQQSENFKGLSRPKRVCLKQVSCFNTMYVIK